MLSRTGSGAIVALAVIASWYAAAAGADSAPRAQPGDKLYLPPQERVPIW